MELKPLLLALVACSGSKTKIEDAKPIIPSHPADAARPVDAAPLPGKGDVSIRVEWHDVPLDARKPGTCGPHVAPTTTWGIPDAVVTLTAPGTPPSRTARVDFDTCFSPRIVLASDTLTLASGSLSPTNVTVKGEGSGAEAAVQLPIAGHQVEVPVTPGTTALIAPASQGWVIVPKTPYAAITDASGVAVLRDVPSGTYPVTAWFPAAGRSAKGEITVTAGQLAELTVQLQP